MAKRRKKKASKKRGKKRTKKKTAKRRTKKRAKKRTKKRSKKRAKKRPAKRKKAKRKGKRKPNAAFMAPLTPSPALAQIVGSRALSRPQVVKKMWQYIKRRKLQDRKNKRMINSDAKLKAVFKKPKVSMFEMNKLLKRHLR